jgi:hypothetical protein
MTHPVAAIELPGGTLLARYRLPGGHVDCYAVTVPLPVSLSRFITAFYSSSAFGPERWLLGILLGKWSNAEDVAHLAAGQTTRFAAWSVEVRHEDEILLCDYQGRTRSWLMVRPVEGGTRLHFGSAVVPAQREGARLLFRALLRFHRWYSVQLLSGAVSRL